MKLAKWDARALVADCDLRELAPYLGIKTRRYGSTTFMECLSGMHTETQINHCEAKRNGCRCYTCHASYENGSANPDSDWNDTISVVRQFRRMTGGDASFNAACETIAEFLVGSGGKERYLISGSEKLRKVFPYSREELVSAGFSDDYATRRAMQELFEKDEKFFNSVVLDKLQETIGKLQKIAELSADQELTDRAEDMLQSAASLYSRMTGKRLAGRLFR